MTLLHYLGLPPSDQSRYLHGRILTTPERVLHAVKKQTGFDIEQLKAKSRKQAIVFVRHATIYALRKYTNLSLKKIGSRVSRDYTTVINSIKVAESLIETDKDFEKMFNGIIEKI